MNNVSLMGRLAGEPELKHTTSGIEVLTFSIAVNRDYVKQGEERQTDFIDCVAWRKTAEFISKYFRKGQMISLTGTLQTRSYQDKAGNNRKVVEVQVANVYFCGGKEEQRGTNSFQKGNTSIAEQEPNAADFAVIEDDEDLPF